MQVTYRIELKIDISPEETEKLEAVRQAFREAAKTTYAVAVLMSGKRKPQVAVFADKFFDGTEIINPFDEGEEP